MIGAVDKHAVQDRRLEVALETVQVPEHALADEVHHGVVLNQVILQGGARERHPSPRSQLLDRHSNLRRFGAIEGRRRCRYRLVVLMDGRNRAPPPPPQGALLVYSK